MAKAGKRKAIIHKASHPYVWTAFARFTECGLDLSTVALDRITWRGVICKNCLRCKPKRKR